MAGLGHSYAPAAGAIGPAAYGAGLGTWQTRQSERGDARKLAEAQFKMNTQSTLLNAGLQNRSQQAQQAAQQQQMWLGAALQGQQQLFQQQLQQQELADNLAYRQQMGQMQLGLQREMGFAELDQQTQIQALRNRPEASAAWQQLNAQRQMLDKNLQEGFLTPDMHQQLVQQHSMEVAGFDPAKYPYAGQFEPGRDMGDVWQENRSFPFGDMQIDVTRNRDGEPKLTEWSKIELQERAQAYYEGQKAKQGKTLDAAKPAVPLTDFAKLYQSLAEANGTTDPKTMLTTPADESVVMPLMDKMLNAYQQRFGVAQPGGGWAGLALPQSLQGLVGSELNSPPSQQGAYNVPTPQQLSNVGSNVGQLPNDPTIQQQPQGLQQMIHFNDGSNADPLRFAENILKVNPPLVFRYLTEKYGDSAEQVLASGDPYDIALVTLQARRIGGQ